MHIIGLNHFNITAPHGLIHEVRDFYVEVLGLEVGDRPGFRRKGFWLYAGKEPLVHLTACDESDRRTSVESAPGFFDHVAFSCKGLPGMVARLKYFNVPYELVEIDSLKQTQLFVRDPSGVGVELNFVNESVA